MKHFLFAIAFLSSAAFADQSYSGWIVGKNYLAQWIGSDSRIDSEFQLGEVPLEEDSTHAFDPKTCRLWTTGKAGTLAGYLNTNLQPDTTLKVSAGRIVSPLRNGKFYFLAGDNDLQMRGENGGLALNFFLADGDKLIQLQTGETNSIWGLFFAPKEHRIWLRLYDAEFGLKKEIPVATAKVIWQNPRLHVNATTGEAWVGYSASAPGLANTPMVKRFLPDGKEGSHFTWGERGLFFTQCQEGDNLIAARDLPTMPYTVPVYSFLDKLVPGAKPAQEYAAPVNYFIDAVSCREKSFWMVQRSIFGSEGSYLVGFDRTEQKEITRLKLEGPADEIYRCDPLRRLKK